MEVTDENYDIFSPKEKDEIKALHSSKKMQIFREKGFYSNP